MKKQIKYIITLSLVLIAGISCKKEYLTPVPLTTVSDATAFDTPERILGNVRSLYSARVGLSSRILLSRWMWSRSSGFLLSATLSHWQIRMKGGI